MNDQAILSFTPAATEHLAGMIEKNPSKGVFRLGVKKTGCNGYMYIAELVAAAKKDDVLVAAVSDLQVAVAADAVSIVQGTQVDYVEKSFGMMQLDFINPNAIGACGCGESFNLAEEQDE
jgi:iron-sulfur cluster assembly accessory protein